MPSRSQLYVHPALRRLLDGPFGASFRFGCAVLLAAVFGGVIAGVAAPVVVPSVPFVAGLACPPGHRVTTATTAEVDPERPPERIRTRAVWLACRDADGHVLADRRPHDVVVQTLWLIVALALLPVMLRAVALVSGRSGPRGLR